MCNCCDNKSVLPINRELSTVRGDTFARTVIVKMGDEPLMLGDDGKCRLYIFAQDDIIVQKIYTSENQDEHGKITITIYPEDTQNLEAGAYHYEIEIKIGSMIVTPLAGNFLIVEDMITPERRQVPPPVWRDVSGDTVTADKLISGYTAHNAQGELVTGEIPDNGAISVTLDGYNSTAYTIANGYITGGVVSIAAETVLTLASLSSIKEALIAL